MNAAEVIDGRPLARRFAAGSKRVSKFVDVEFRSFDRL